MMDLRDERSLMIPGVIGWYSHEGQIEIEGIGEALTSLAKLLEDGYGIAVFIVPEGEDSRPYDGFLYSIKVNDSDSSILVTREGHVLHISGSQEKLEILACNIRFLVTQNSGPEVTEETSNHLHEEYYPQHPFLHQDALSLIITYIKKI